jgi:hypothetical protein
MKTGNHDQGVIFEDKKQRVREAAQEGAADIFEYDGELPGIIAHPIDQGVNRLAKTAAQPGGFAFIPILRLDQFSARAA